MKRDLHPITPRVLGDEVDYHKSPFWFLRDCRPGRSRSVVIGDFRLVHATLPLPSQHFGRRPLESRRCIGDVFGEAGDSIASARRAPSLLPVFTALTPHSITSFLTVPIYPVQVNALLTVSSLTSSMNSFPCTLSTTYSVDRGSKTQIQGLRDCAQAVATHKGGRAG